MKKNIQTKHNFKMTNLISKRAAIEKSNLGIGVSTRVRKYWRDYYRQKGLPQMLGRNIEINTFIAGDFAKAQPVHRFVLKSGEAAEIRKSHQFYYVAAIREGGQYDIIAIQPRFREASPEVRELRLSPEWLKAKWWKKQR